MSTSYSWEGKVRYGSFQLRIECVGVQVKLWHPLRVRAIPEHFWGDDAWRGAISSVRTFDLYHLPTYSISIQRNDKLRQQQATILVQLWKQATSYQTNGYWHNSSPSHSDAVIIDRLHTGHTCRTFLSSTGVKFRNPGILLNLDLWFWNHET